MFFFAILGTSQVVKKIVQQGNYYCQTCAKSNSFSKMRIDQNFQFFFINIFSIKKGQEYVGCDTCYTPLNPNICPSCEIPFEKNSNYCSGCGHKLN